MDDVPFKTGQISINCDTDSYSDLFNEAILNLFLLSTQ